MRWFLAFHLIFIICWFAGLFYLPRLFVYHAGCRDKVSRARFVIMERRLYWGIMTPAGILSTLFGLYLFAAQASMYISKPWMQWKLLCVGILWLYHILCGQFLVDFRCHRNQHTTHFYRWFNEIPTVLLFMIIILAVVQP